MRASNGRFSKFIRPLTMIIDLVIVNTMAFVYFPFIEREFSFCFLLSLSWIMLSWLTDFYDVYRHTRIVRIVEKLFKQFVLQFIVVTSFNGFFTRFTEQKELFMYGVSTFVLITLVKFGIFFTLKYIRRVLGGNFRNVVVIGAGKEIEMLKDLFITRTDLGYRISNSFEGIKEDSCLDEIKGCILNNKIDEIYIQFSLVKDSDYHDLLEFADNNLKTLKYVPSQKQVLTHNLKVDYYDFIPVVPRRVIALDKIYNRFVKRLFDIIFSLFTIVFVLSWLMPLIAILIKTESKGPILFKQKRTGLNDKEFYCYKFRSMKLNEESDKVQATKNDDRITKIGAFIRKTSIDEFPQFFNVLLGDMSIVGPRPHMVVHTKMYAKRVNRFMLRHLVKPGITGMAQTHGYRGEIESNRDIVNRFKYDLFYLENWSIFLDLKIIYLTIYNIFKGEDKAY